MLIEGKAIQLPLVCAFNADFDGDQMAVHVPLSLKRNWKPACYDVDQQYFASGQWTPIIVPSQDIVLGLYYMTLQRDGAEGEGMLVSDIAELEHALDQKTVTLHSKIKARIEEVDAEAISPPHSRHRAGLFLPKSCRSMSICLMDN